jgi:hypothetical protein
VKNWGHGFYKLIKTNVEKMSAFHLSTIFMKTKDLHPYLHDVDENKRDGRWTQG